MSDLLWLSTACLQALPTPASWSRLIEGGGLSCDSVPFYYMYIIMSPAKQLPHAESLCIARPS